MSAIVGKRGLDSLAWKGIVFRVPRDIAVHGLETGDESPDRHTTMSKTRFAQAGPIRVWLNISLNKLGFVHRFSRPL